MAYLLWGLIGIVTGFALMRLLGPQADVGGATGRVFGGALGGLIGGIVGDGLPAAMAGVITVPSVIGAAIGGAIIAWAAQSRLADMKD